MREDTLTCSSCGRDFVFSREERARFERQGFDLPRRCPDCRKAKKKGAGQAADGRRDRKRGRKDESWDSF